MFEIIQGGDFMQKRILGGTNYEVSVVGLGGIPIQRVDKSTAADIIREALNQGMNFIDTARGYTISEELIGQGLQIVGREKFILATKSMVRTYEGMLEEVKASLSRWEVASNLVPLAVRRC